MKKVILVILLIILTAGVSGGGVYLWERGINEKEITILQNTIDNLEKQVISKVENNTSTNKTSGLKTYTDEKYGFSIQLPNNWVKLVNNKSKDIMDFETTNKDDYLRLFIYKLDNPEKKNLQQVLDDASSCPPENRMGCLPAPDVSNWQKLNILGKPAFLSNVAIGATEGTDASYYLYVDFGNYFLVFRGATDYDHIDDFQQVYNDIIQTIK